MKATPLSLFPSPTPITSDEKMIRGATFFHDRKLRVQLWRIWDLTKPQVLFIGLNPSVADADKDDPTIRRVIGFSRSWGYGGVHMMNCFSYVSTDPKRCDFTMGHDINYFHLEKIKDCVAEVIFCWGNNDYVKDLGVYNDLIHLFPDAKALGFNKNGSPKHPLYVKANTKPVPFTDKNSL